MPSAAAGWQGGPPPPPYIFPILENSLHYNNNVNACYFSAFLGLPRLRLIGLFSMACDSFSSFISF